jgi:site-specific DNA-methyltransferase (adenine-specific)
MNVQLHLGDCLEVMRSMPDKSVDAVITDPPYPDYYTEEFRYFEGILQPLEFLACRQFIFWSAKSEFPLSYTARHVWDKITGAACQYDFVYERNGQKRQRVFRGHRINSTVSAQFAREIFTGHKSQKPLNVIVDMIEKFTKPGATILDPFMGSGTTGVACVQTGRNFIGIEIDPTYFAIAERRIQEAQLQPTLPLEVQE